MNKAFPRVLVISYNSFLSTNANGRTLMNLFANWDPNCIAQLYMSNDYPDFSVCNNYYRITDMDALKSVFFQHNNSGKIDISKKGHSNISAISKVAKEKRTNKTIRLLRQYIWLFNHCLTDEFYNWIDDFSPQIVLLFSGNNAFIDKIAWKVIKKYRVPLVLYNCEDYYLKPKEWQGLNANILRKHCDKVFEATMRKASGIIYNSDTLLKSYNEKFPNQNAITLYNPADLFFYNKNFKKENNTVAYLGNIGMGRDESLCEIADVLSHQGIKLHVYGPLIGENAANRIINDMNIEYHGSVSYEECKSVMATTDILVHAESFKLGADQHLKHAFSTKIADSLASGACLFVYAPKNIALTDYLINCNAAVVASTHKEMEKKLTQLINDDSFKVSYIKNAQYIVRQNHTSQEITNRFLQFITMIAEESNDNQNN